MERIQEQVVAAMGAVFGIASGFTFVAYEVARHIA
jgi:hypothetical protein